MHKTRKIDVKCAGCDTFLWKTRGKKKIVYDGNDARRLSLLLQNGKNINDFLYQKCRLSAYKSYNSGINKAKEWKFECAEVRRWENLIMYRKYQ